MKRYYFILLMVFSLVCSSMACSILNRDKDTGAPPEDQPEATISGAQDSEFEVAPLGDPKAFDASKFKSYRGEMTMTFDGTVDQQPVRGTISMTVMATSDPVASHLVMNVEGNLPDMDEDFSKFEVYIIEDKMYINLGGEDGWMVLPADPEDLSNDMFFSYQDITDLPPTAKRKLLPETVNGIRCWHYVVDETDLPPEDTEFDRMKADLWVSVEDGFVVKIDMTASGNFNKDGESEQPIDEGTIRMLFDIKDINAIFTIELPPEAASAEDFGFGEDLFGGMAWEREDVPLPDDAEVDFSLEQMVSASTSLTVDEARDFMLAQLEANGWTLNSVTYEDDESYFADFTKEDETLTIMVNISEDDPEKTSLLISIDQE